MVNAKDGQMLPLQDLTSATFAPRVGSPFRIVLDASSSLTVELIAATEFPQRPGGNGAALRRPPFSLLFRGPLTPILPQRIYGLEHDELGGLELFLVPIGPDERGMRYEVIFN